MKKNIDKLLLEKGAQGSISMIFAEARKRNVKVQFVDRQVLEKESVTGRHQGVIAFAACKEYATLEDVYRRAEESGEPLFVIVCDELEDAHNLGAILRSAEAAGCHGVIIPNAVRWDLPVRCIRLRQVLSNICRSCACPT